MNDEKARGSAPRGTEGKGADLGRLSEHVDGLGSEIRALKRAATKRWKTSAWVFGIICVVVAGYLAVLRFVMLDELLHKESLIELGVGQAAMLVDNRQALVDLIRKQEGPLVDAVIGPQIEKLKRDLPDLLPKYAE